MSNHTINDLRDHLFATLKALRDPERPMDIERAKAVSDVAQRVIETAKVEVDYLRVTGGGEAPFLDAIGSSNLPPQLPGGSAPKDGVEAVTRHFLR